PRGVGLMTDRKTSQGAAPRAATGRIALALAIVLLAPAGIAMAQPPRDQKAGPGTSPAPGLAGRLGAFVQGQADPLLGPGQAMWPNRPEWVAMFIDILKGSQLGPGDGWFKKAVAQTRYDWNEARRRLDRDHDGKIKREEFPGADADFARLDRDRDGVIGERDF